MQKIIFTTNFYCKFCKKDIPLNVFGDMASSFPENHEEEAEAKKWGEHYHWTDNHRRCAICGDLVFSGKQDEPKGLNLIVNNGQVLIHEQYERETMDKAHGEQLLIVHNGCAKTLLENESV